VNNQDNELYPLAKLTQDGKRTYRPYGRNILPTEAGWTEFKPKKCRLFARTIEFLGHIISEAGMAMMPEKVAAIKDWLTPETVSELRSFLGTASYYRRSVRDFAAIAVPLHKLTRAIQNVAMDK
jgi:hypothetical protein